MYKALNYWVFGGFTGEKTPYEFIDFAASQGLDGIELTVGDALPADITEAECKKIASYAAEKNVGLRTLATGFYGTCSLGAADEAERLRAVEFSKKYLQIGAWLGVKCVLMIPGATFVAWDLSRPVVPYAVVWENSRKSIKELLPVAHQLGVDIALENVWTRFLLSPMEWKIYLDSFDDPAVGIYFDAGNCCLNGRPEDYVGILGKRIKAVHLKNFEGSDCAGGLHGFGDDLFKGEVDFASLFAALKKIGYEGTFTVEMIPFSRLPDLVLPDQQLAEKVTKQLLSL
ncbi:MAG: sugar phosphate isomerase/epimerase [Victivallaceae bacterium]|nr:sugar phosphate isomerase/epimerase [Victivallaceae bacterium]